MFKFLFSCLFLMFSLITGAFATGTDFTGITSAVDVSTLALGLVAMGALMILPRVARWGAKMLAKFF